MDAPSFVADRNERTQWLERLTGQVCSCKLSAPRYCSIHGPDAVLALASDASEADSGLAAVEAQRDAVRSALDLKPKQDEKTSTSNLIERLCDEHEAEKDANKAQEKEVKRLEARIDELEKENDQDRKNAADTKINLERELDAKERQIAALGDGMLRAAGAPKLLHALSLMDGESLAVLEVEAIYLLARKVLETRIAARFQAEADKAAKLDAKVAHAPAEPKCARCSKTGLGLNPGGLCTFCEHITTDPKQKAEAIIAAVKLLKDSGVAVGIRTAKDAVAVARKINGGKLGGE